jgi:neutral ceramidase
VTGPVTQVGFMGMGQLGQTGRGLHFRLYARAFVVEHVATGRRTVYMSADLCMIYQHVHDYVVAGLQKRFPGYYDATNVLLHGTHTHSGPGGYAIHPLYDVTTAGYHKDNMAAIVSGIIEAISMAHNRLSKGGRILINQGELFDANANRGEYAYLANPLQERLNYNASVDRTMVLLRLQDENGRDIGAINFFAVHGTSMFNTNRLVSGDK